MGVQVAVEKCEIGHFGDGVAADAGRLRQNARGSPIPAVAADGQAVALQGAPGAAQQTAQERAGVVQFVAKTVPWMQLGRATRQLGADFIRRGLVELGLIFVDQVRMQPLWGAVAAQRCQTIAEDANGVQVAQYNAQEQSSDTGDPGIAKLPA